MNEQFLNWIISEWEQKGRCVVGCRGKVLWMTRPKLYVTQGE